MLALTHFKLFMGLKLIVIHVFCFDWGIKRNLENSLAEVEDYPFFSLVVCDYQYS